MTVGEEPAALELEGFGALETAESFSVDEGGGFAIYYI
jgi:hypothetical protein